MIIEQLMTTDKAAVAEIKKRLVEQKLRYYRGVNAQVLPNTQTPR